MAEAVTGRVYSVVYNRDSYYILNFEGRGLRSVKAKGYFHGLLQVRDRLPLKLTGDWVENKKYGRGFTVRNWDPHADSVEDVVNFLSLGIHGFSDLRWVDALVGRYGLETFDWLTNKANEVQSQPFDNVSAETVAAGILGWKSALSQRDVSALLHAGGLSATDIQAAMIKFGGDAYQVITSNPYRLLEIAGFAYAKTDRLALHLGVSPKDPRRLQGAILWTLQEASRQGHLYMKRGDLWGIVKEVDKKELVYPLPFGENPSKACDEAAAALIQQKAVVLDPDAGLYLPDLYKYERRSAEALAQLLRFPETSQDVSAFVGEYERAHQLQLSEAQKTAVQLLVQHKVLVITGLPGTGKTTVLRAIVRLLEEQGLTFTLMAPTGIAAKRLAAVAGHPASTIHRALKYDGDNWGHHENNRFLTDSVVLDEASMMDQELFYRLLMALRTDTRLILVGDDAQLPSVGPGNVLRELLDCSVIPKVRLTEVFRQSVKGEIVGSSHRINSGQVPDLVSAASSTTSEFRFVRIGDEEKIVDLIVEMAARLKAKNANFQILSPKYDGVVGVNNLNERLREVLNPAGPMEWRSGDQTFRQGDRLMVVQNDYKLGVYNGDVGKLTEIRKDDSVTVKVHGVGASLDMDVSFEKTTAEQKLRLAYAITVHKSQGSEFDTIILPIVRTQGRMLQRNLLYTAVTRARKRVWLLGEEAAIQKAIENNKVVRRNTMLSKSVRAFLESGVVAANDAGQS